MENRKASCQGRRGRESRKGKKKGKGRDSEGITPQNETNNTEKAYEMALERNVAGEWQLYEQGEAGEGSKRLGHIVAIAHDVSVPLYPSGSACHAAVRQLVNGNEDVAKVKWQLGD